MKQNYSCVLLVCLLICSLQLYAQTPDFSFALNQNCTPVKATFTNASTGFSAGAMYSLNFGESASGIFGFSTLTHSYLTGGTYAATLTVTDNGKVFTTTKQIVIYKNPVVLFSPGVSKVCAKNAVVFISASTAGDGTIAGYLWDFGDGAVNDTLANKVSHTYTSGGKITAGLTVTNSYGCATSVTVANIITVASLPKAGFTASTNIVCQLTDAVNFTNATTGGAQPVSYVWNFGDGATSNSTNAAHNYATKGKFTVTLIATSSEGCTDTSAGTTLTVATAKSGITAPALLCLNSNLLFTDSSSPKTAHPVWLLDNRTVASDVHEYTTTFTDTNLHTLQLVNVYGSCTDTATKMVKAQTAPVPSPFTYQLKGYCNAASPTAAFTEAGTGNVKWEWDFNNTNAAIFTPTDFTKTPNYTYAAAGAYYVQLRVTDASGCMGTVRQPVTIAKNTLFITSTEGIFGCHNLATTFKANSSMPIAQYNWTFSDDNSTSTADTPHHSFHALGGYSAFLKVKTSSGCTDTSRLKLYIGNEPKFNFSVLNPADTTLCGNKLIRFKLTGNPDSLIGTYYWNFGDSPVYTLVNYDSIFTHQYNGDGAFSVSMVVKNHGCNDTVTKTNYIKVLPPFAKISSVVNSCDTRQKISFKETSIKAQTYTWDFGDGLPTYTYDSSHRNTVVTHTFPATHLYKVVLITGSNGCFSRDSVTVGTLGNQKPVLSAAQTSICASDTLHTTVSGMENNPFGAPWQYTVKAVEYSDGSPFTGTYSYPDASPVNPLHIDVKNISSGNRQLRIITHSGAYNCPDTTNFIAVQAYGPKAGFLLGDTSLCLSDKALLTDASQAGALAPIVKWQWLYGDGTADTLTVIGSTSHRYASPGTFAAKLIVTDQQNCRDTAYYPAHPVTIKGPKAAFSVVQNPILPNTPETFVNLTDAGSASRANNSYWWLGDGTSSTSNKDSLVHKYNQYGDDTVTLVASNSSTGCSDTATSVVHVKNTNLSFTYASKFLNPRSTCPPVLVYFKNTSVNFGIVSWNFGDSLMADNINTPTHTYYKPGIYKVTIYGYYADNTYDSSWEYINIAGSSAVLHADVVTGCGSRQVVFTATTQSTSSLLWDFGDGTSSPDSVTTHTYTTPNVYTPTITVKNGANCAASYSLATPITIDSLRINIEKDSVLQCHQLLVNFTPTVAFSLAKNHAQTLDYTWQFGNGSSASKKDTGTATYVHSGLYNVSLIASSPYGCKDTLITQVSYQDFPFASISGQTEFCENTPVAFAAVKTNGADALTYRWQFQNDSSRLQAPPAQTFSASGTNTITLWVNKNGCADTLSQQLTIHSQPHVAMLVSESIVCLGSPILFDVKPVGNTADSLQYFWNLGDGKDSAAIKSANFVYAANGTYPVLLRTTSSFGCKEELKDTVAVLQTPHVFINAPMDICKNGTVSFTSASTSSSSAQYLWHFSDNTTSTQQNPSPKTYNAAGTHTVYVVAKLGNCFDTAYHQLTVHDNPQVNLTATAQSVCFGDTVQLTAHNGKDYQWAINNVVVTGANVASPRLTPNNNTKYSVSVTDGNGCRNADSLTVAVVKQQHISVASTFINVCAGNAAKLSASGTDTYHWINGTDLTATDIANPSTKNLAQNKTYVVVGSDGYGCFRDTAYVQVAVRNNPVIQVDNNSRNITTPAGAPTPLSASSSNNIVSWNWQPAVYLSCSDCTTPISKPRQNLRYLVEGTDNYGCKGVDTVSVNVICKENLAGVPEIFSPNDDGRNDRFGIAGYGIKNIKHFVIFGRNGNKVFERNNVNAFDTNATWDGTCNNVQMPVGTYIYVIEATCDAGEMYNLKGTITLVR